MRVVAVADTHLKSWEVPEKLEEMIKKADIVVHAGDFDSYEVYERFADFELVAVAGDSDDERIRSKLPSEAVFEAEGLKFGVVHRGNYLNEFHDLGYKALEMGVDFLIFGHVHRFVLERLRVPVLCPGSPTQPRLSVGSFAELVVEDGKVEVRMHTTEFACGIDALRCLR
ncbi:MAG: metallophosphoesterase [Archaeoglobaceae archaeon]